MSKQNKQSAKELQQSSDLYLLMKSNTINKYEVMSECLRQFKQVPQILQNFAKTSNNQYLSELIQCGNKFIELATFSDDPLQTEISLFHRFFCRIREIIYSCLTHYLHTNSFLFIRELLIQINKQVMEYKPGSGYSTVLVALADILVASVGKIARTRKLSVESLSKLMSAKIEYRPRIVTEQKQDDYVYKPDNKLKERSPEKMNNNSKSKMSTQVSLTKSLGLDIMNDIDTISFQKIKQSTSTDDLFKDCLNRNKFISFLIKKYEQKHRAYLNRPEYRRNRQNADYKPTTWQRSATTAIRKRANMTSMSPQKKSNSPDMKSRTKNYENSKFQISTTEIFNEDFVKQDILNQIYAYRQKITMHKVMIGMSDMEIKTSMNKTMKTGHFYKTSKPKSQRPNTQSQSYRLKSSTTRSYLSGLISIPLR